MFGSAPPFVIDHEAGEIIHLVASVSLFSSACSFLDQLGLPNGEEQVNSGSWL